MGVVIEPIGAVQVPDAAGQIPNPCRAAALQDAWRPAVEALVGAYRECLGPDLVAVYLRGSVAAGRARRGVSDVDSLGVVSGGRAPRAAGGPGRARVETPPALAARAAELRTRFPFAEGFEVLLLDRDRLASDPAAAPWRFLLVTQARCVAGVDLAAGWPPARLDDWEPLALRALAADHREYRDAWASEGPSRALNSWFFKRVLRAGYRLLLAEERAFTRDLYPCMDALARRFPARAGDARAALRLVLDPEVDPAEGPALAARWVPFLLGEARRRGLVPAGP